MSKPTPWATCVKGIPRLMARDPRLFRIWGPKMNPVLIWRLLVYIVEISRRQRSPILRIAVLRAFTRATISSCTSRGPSSHVTTLRLDIPVGLREMAR